MKWMLDEVMCGKLKKLSQNIRDSSPWGSIEVIVLLVPSHQQGVQSTTISPSSFKKFVWRVFGFMSVIRGFVFLRTGWTNSCLRPRKWRSGRTQGDSQEFHHLVDLLFIPGMSTFQVLSGCLIASSFMQLGTPNTWSPIYHAPLVRPRSCSLLCELRTLSAFFNHHWEID